MKTIILINLALIATSLAYKPSLGTFSNERVINGVDAKENEFPHQLSLRIRGSHICGGSILNEQWVVTAGHCILDLPVNDMTVNVGILKTTETGQSNRIAKAIVHPDYKGGVNPNDIALVKLDGKIEFNDSVKPIGLPNAGDEPSGKAVISGWGSISTTNYPNYPVNLQRADLEIVNNKDCGDALAKLLGSSYPLNAASNVCSGPLNHSAGACSGDSGGPLIQGNTLIGVVSWGIVPCGIVGAPSVYTKVSNFVGFINSNIGQ